MPMAAAILRPQCIVQKPAEICSDKQAWAVYYEGALERSGQRNHPMKLLHPEHVRSLVRRDLGAYCTEQPTLHDGHLVRCMPQTSNGPTDAATAADPSDLHRLLALDIDDLLKHTHRVQRERRTAANIQLIPDGSRPTNSTQRSRTKTASIGRSSLHMSPAAVQTRPRRKRRRACRSTSPATAPGAVSPTLQSADWRGQCASPASIRERPLRMGLSTPEIQRMDAALRLARYDTQLLTKQLQRFLGSDEGPIPIKAARVAVDAHQARGGAGGDLDMIDARCLSRPVLRALGFEHGDNPEQEPAETMTKTDCHEDALPVAGEPGESNQASGLLESPAAKVTASLRQEMGSSKERHMIATSENDETHGEVPETSSEEDESGVVDRKRLISALAAEERIRAMANHLGPADPTNDLRSLVLQARWSFSTPIRLGGHSRDFENGTFGINGIPRSLSAEAEAATNLTAMDRHAQAISAFPRLGNDSTRTRHNGPTWTGKQRRVQSAEHPLLRSDQDDVFGPFLTAATNQTAPTGGRRDRGGGFTDAEGRKDGRKKRCRGDWETGRDWAGGVSTLSQDARSGVSGPDVVTMHRANQDEVPDASGAVARMPCSLPKLKASKLSCESEPDNFDRSGGRETPSVLQRSFLSGGGHKSWEAVKELRRELAITEGGLIVLKARVRADVAWVQETVGARMSRRARESCCKWGSEKIADLTHRWEARSAGRALGTWSRHRQYMANRDLVRAFIMRRGAAQARRLLEVWGHRLITRALEEWRRRVRLERRAEEAVAASILQRVALGFLGRRRLRYFLATRSAIRIQTAARGRAGRRRAQRARESIRRNEAAEKIQGQARKRAQRHRAQRIVALKRRRRAATKVQKCVRGFIGRRKALTVREALLHQHMSVAIQAAWRGLQARREVVEKRRDAEAVQTTQNEAATLIQAAQRRKAAKRAADTKRTIAALQRRKSAEIAAVSIQRVVRGKAARASTAKDIADREERQRRAAAVHIQRVTRGRAERKRAASARDSGNVSTSSFKPPKTCRGANQQQSGEDFGGSAPANFTGLGVEKVEDAQGIPEAPSLLFADRGCTEVLVPSDQQREEDDDDDGSSTPSEKQGRPVGDEGSTCHRESSSPSDAENHEQRQPSSNEVLSELEDPSRAQAASRIQAFARGTTARAEAYVRRKKRDEEEAHRASVWGLRDGLDSEVDGHRHPHRRHPEGPTASRKASPLHTAEDVTDSEATGSRASLSLFSTKVEASSRHGNAAAEAQARRPQAARLIQAAFRGGKARWEADRRREEVQSMKAAANARARQKLEAEAAVRIQTQARARAARVKRDEHRQRHVARVGSIRSRGKAAADDLRALSRPGTAAALVAGTLSAVAGGAAVERGRGEEGGGRGGDTTAVLDGAAGALLPISLGSLESSSPMPPEASPRSLPLPPAIGLVAIRSPSSVGSPIEATAAATAVAAVGPVTRASASASAGVGGAATAVQRSRSRAATGGRSRSPSAARPLSASAKTSAQSPGRSAPNKARRSLASPASSRTSPVDQRGSRRSVVGSSTQRISPRPETETYVPNGGGGDGGAGAGMDAAAVERMHSQMKRDLEEELHRELRGKIDKELAAKLAEQEEARKHVLEEAEKERRRGREAVEEAMRAVQEAHSKDSEEIARIRASLKEEEAARRAEQDAGRQEYERCLAEVRAEAERGRLAAEAVEALRREVEDEKRRHQTEAEAKAREREQAKERQEKEAEGERETANVTGDDGSDPPQAIGQGEQEGTSTAKQQQECEEGENQRQRELEQQLWQQQKLEEQRIEEQQRNVLQQLAAENAEKQRVALLQLQAQLREEEARRLADHAAWEARQAEEEEIVKEERRLELEAIETLKRQLEEEKHRANQEQELRNAEVRLQLESLRLLQEKAQEQERVRQEAEEAARALAKAKEDAIVRAGAKFMKDDDLDFDDGEDVRDSSNETGSASGGSRRTHSAETLGGGSRGTSAGTGTGLVPADVEEAVKREIESATGSRLAQVEDALLELSRKQAELESREKTLTETSGSLVGTSSPSTAMTLAAAAEDAPGASVVAAGGAATPVEWVEYWDESAGASYFFNTVTQEASWTNPYEGAEAAAGSGARAVTVASGAGEQGRGENLAGDDRAGGRETLSQPEDGRAKWTECLDETSGATYYYNVVTGEAVWEKPPELSEKSETVAGVPQFDRPEEWVCYLDETSGEEYWFNLTTGETHWGST